MTQVRLTRPLAVSRYISGPPSSLVAGSAGCSVHRILVSCSSASLSVTFHHEGDDSGEVRRGGDLTLVPPYTVNNFNW